MSQLQAQYDQAAVWVNKGNRRVAFHLGNNAESGEVISVYSTDTGWHFGKFPAEDFAKQFMKAYKDPAASAKTALNGTRKIDPAAKDALTEISQRSYTVEAAPTPTTEPPKTTKKKVKATPEAATEGAATPEAATEGAAPATPPKPRGPARDYGIAPSAIIAVPDATKVTGKGEQGKQFTLLAAHAGKTVEEFTQSGGDRSTLRRAIRRNMITLTPPAVVEPAATTTSAEPAATAASAEPAANDATPDAQPA